MSYIFTQWSPIDFGAGSGLVWLEDIYASLAEASAAYPNVRWSYLYSGYTAVGDVSNYSFITVTSGGTEMEDFWAAYSGMYLPGCYWVTSGGSRIGVIESRHTASGAPEEAWRSWTVDEAAIMEAYERTIGNVTGSNYLITTTNYSGNHWNSSFAAPKQFVITPGHYCISYGHVWFYHTCHVDGSGARFSVHKRYAGDNMGTSAVHRTPTGNEAKAAVTIGRDQFILPNNPNVFHYSEITLPAISAYLGRYEWGFDSGQFHLYDGALLRINSMIGCKINRININGPTKYGIIFCPESVGAYFNNLEIFNIYDTQIAIKFNLQNTESDGIAWLNGTTFRGGWIQNAASASGWDPNQYPTVIFDSDNTNENPNRDPADDIFRTNYERFNKSPNCWVDDVATENTGTVQYFRMSGMQNWSFTRGRFEGQQSAVQNADTGALVKKQSWLKGNISANMVKDTLSQELWPTIPSEYIGNGFDFEQMNIALPGYSQLGTHYPNATDMPGDNTASTQHISYDIYFDKPGAKIHMQDAAGEKVRSLYIDTVVDPISGNSTPVIKTVLTPSVFLKWKLDGETEYHNNAGSYPVGSKIWFKFGDFSSLPTNSLLNYIRPYIRQYTTLSSYTVAQLINSGLEAHISAYYYLDDTYNNNALYVQHGSYVEAYCVFTQSGIIYPAIWMANDYPPNYWDDKTFSQLITISG